MPPGALSDAQYKSMKVSLKRQERGEEEEAEGEGDAGGEDWEDEDVAPADAGPGEGGAGKGIAEGKKPGRQGLNGRGERSKKNKGKGEGQKGSGSGVTAAAGAGAAALVPLTQIHLKSDGQCNMDGSVDEHYRYKMPAIEVKVEGTTKMIRTVLTNMAGCIVWYFVRLYRMVFC